MVVKWLSRAEIRLQEIYDYYLAVAGEKTAKKITGRIIEKADLLSRMPMSASVELLLDDRPEGFRSMVVKRIHKIVYFIENNSVNIVTVFDCRRDPAKLRESVLQAVD
jgi:plasmid stabilization system protein ParE